MNHSLTDWRPPSAPTQQPIGVRPPQLLELPSGLQQLPDVLMPGLIEGRGRLLEQAEKKCAETFQRGTKSGYRAASSAECARIASLQRATSSTTPGGGRPAPGRPGAGRAGEVHAAGGLMSAAIEGRSGPVEWAKVGTRAGHDLLGHRRTAHHRTRFENKRLVARACEVESGSQTVVPGADDD